MILIQIRRGEGGTCHVTNACKCQMALSVSEFDKRNQTESSQSRAHTEPRFDRLIKATTWGTIGGRNTHAQRLSTGRSSNLLASHL